MARTLNRLTAVRVAGLRKPGLHADGGNLYFRVAPGGSRGWIFRFTINGRARDCGLGSYPAVSLASAREEAERCRRQLGAGTDPIEARNAKRIAQRLEAARAMTFSQCANAYVASHEAAWRNDKHQAQWRSTLATYVEPIIGPHPVTSIDTTLVLRVLEPIWHAKPETASRVRGRIEAILNWATVRGYRDGSNPAQWRGHLDHLLPAKDKVRPVVHHAALPYGELGSLMKKIRGQSSVTAHALEFLVLTASRTSETLGATWNEISVDRRLWIIPSERMKGGREHRVPLSDAALALISAMTSIRSSEFVFPGTKQDRPLSQMSLAMLLRRLGFAHITVHGFRSTFRDWAAEETSFPREAAELALAHAIPDAVEAAYRRGDMLEKRRELMVEWAAHCAGTDPFAPR